MRHRYVCEELVRHWTLRIILKGNVCSSGSCYSHLSPISSQLNEGILKLSLSLNVNSSDAPYNLIHVQASKEEVPDLALTFHCGSHCVVPRCRIEKPLIVQLNPYVCAWDRGP